uniref:Uncharacterized protein n=1 Tax=Anguilla anguilla TaxID=7936 RepID=A0A0E9XG31_ANGAN
MGWVLKHKNRLCSWPLQVVCSTLQEMFLLCFQNGVLVSSRAALSASWHMHPYLFFIH